MNTGDLTVRDFADQLASGEPIPGGGGASALSAALAVGLCGMVTELTVGKTKYAAVQGDMTALSDEASSLRSHLLALADADAAAFLPLSKAYGLPTETEEQKGQKRHAMEEALVAASEVPLEVMRCCVRIIAISEEVARKGSVMAVSDAAAAATIAEGAAKAAALNVYINTNSMLDRDRALEFNKRADELLTTGIPLARSIFDIVAYRLRNKEKNM